VRHGVEACQSRSQDAKGFVEPKEILDASDWATLKRQVLEYLEMTSKQTLLPSSSQSNVLFLGVGLETPITV
jgi:hypothetical protein